MEQGQIGRLDMGTGKQQEKIGISHAIKDQWV